MTRFFTAADGARIAYRDQGRGLPVLCLSGLTRTKEDFDDAMPALAGCRVIRMDYRGRGESAFTGPSTYTIAQEAADAMALMDHLGVSQVALLGTSRGGMIGMGIANMAPNRLLGLCLNDIGPELHRPGLERVRDYVGRRPAAKTLAELAEKLPAFNPGFEGVTPAQWQAMAARLYRETPEGLELNYDPDLRHSVLLSFSAQPFDMWKIWPPGPDLPLALIRGVNSDLLTQETADRMQETRPDMIRAEVPGRAHVPFLDEPESVAALRSWVEKMR